MNEQMETLSVQHLVDRFLPSTLFLRHLRMVGTTSVDGVAFAAQTFLDGDEEWGVASLLRLVDMTCFFGSTKNDGGIQFNGLEAEGIHYHDREEFYDAVANIGYNRMKLFKPGFATFVDEGSIPQEGMTFAVNMDAVYWRYIMPCVVIELMAMREGKFKTPLPFQATFKHADSPEFRRFVAMMYGSLVIEDSSQVLVLNDEA